MLIASNDDGGPSHDNLINLTNSTLGTYYPVAQSAMAWATGAYKALAASV